MMHKFMLWTCVTNNFYYSDGNITRGTTMKTQLSYKPPDKYLCVVYTRIMLSCSHRRQF